MSAPNFERMKLQSVSVPTTVTFQGIIDNPALKDAFDQINEALHTRLTPEILRRAATEAQAVASLREAMSALPEPISPQLARSVQAEENWWRKIESDHAMLTSTETATLLGKSSNRAYAAHQRKQGRMLGYKRGNSYRYPKFQFDLRSRTVHPVILDLLLVSQGYGVPDEELVMWLCTPSGYFEEQDEPVHHLHDHDALLKAAEMRFGPSW